MCTRVLADSQRAKRCEHSRVEKRIDDKHLDLEEKLYGAALMGLPCNKVDPVNFWYVDTKKHAPYQYPQPKGITIPGKVWDSDNGSWVDEE